MVNELNLNNKEQETLNAIGKIRMVRKSVMIYNNLCVDCKRKVLKNPKMPMEEYCSDCLAMAKKIWAKQIRF